MATLTNTTTNNNSAGLCPTPRQLTKEQVGELIDDYGFELYIAASAAILAINAILFLI